VELELKNPLKVPVQFTDVHVVCSLLPPGQKPGDTKTPSLVSSDGVIDSPKANGGRASTRSDGYNSDSSEESDKEPPLVTDTYEILLAPLELKRVRTDKCCLPKNLRFSLLLLLLLWLLCRCNLLFGRQKLV